MSWERLIVYFVVITIVLFIFRRPSVQLFFPPGVKIASDFKSRTDAKGRRRSQKHQGIDITGSDGTEIIAIADGLVLAAEDESCWGPTIMIDHTPVGGRSLVALYGHLDHMLVSQGVRVKRGQVIGRLGNKTMNRKCVYGIRHLHLQLGRKPRKSNRNGYWGNQYFLEDGHRGLNPHHLWADGPGKVTCFSPGKNYPEDKITWPLHCPP